MKFIVCKNYDEMSKKAAEIMIEVVKNNPKATLGLATGSSPIGMYNYMAEAYKNGEVSFKECKSFNLDEYYKISKDNDQSYYYFMNENLFSKIDVNADNVNFLDGNTDDPEAESARYADAIASKGGIDVQLLGIGRNGHIAFNEPSDAFTGESFKIALTQSTIDANSIYFDDIPMPRYAMTMGIGSIMKAKKIVLIATGASKAEAVKGMIKGEVTPQLPASILQQHQDVVIFLDEAAASLL